MNAKIWYYISGLFFLVFFTGIILYKKIPYAGYIVGSFGILSILSAWMYNREQKKEKETHITE